MVIWWGKMNNISVIVLASGLSKRFNGNKLLYKLNGKPMIEHTFEKLSKIDFDKVNVVSRYKKVLSISDKYNFNRVFNDDETNDTAITIKLGMENVNDSLGVMLIVSDEPYLKQESLEKLVNVFLNNNDKICVLSFNNEPRNPIIFPKKYFNELKSLSKNEKGKNVTNKHLEDLILVETDEKELEDIDYNINV